MQIKEEWRATPSGLIRARGLGLALGGQPGPFNAITDIPNVEVGYATLIKGSGALVRGSGPVRTGVTAVLPRPRAETTIIATFPSAATAFAAAAALRMNNDPLAALEVFRRDAGWQLAARIEGREQTVTAIAT